MEKAMIAFSAGEVTQPARVLYEVTPPPMAGASVPCWVSKDAMGNKLVNIYLGNAGNVIPAHLALIVLFNQETREPMEIIEAS